MHASLDVIYRPAQNSKGLNGKVTERHLLRCCTAVKPFQVTTVAVCYHTPHKTTYRANSRKMCVSHDIPPFTVQILFAINRTIYMPYNPRVPRCLTESEYIDYLIATPISMVSTENEYIDRSTALHIPQDRCRTRKESCCTRKHQQINKICFQKKVLVYSVGTGFDT